MEKSTHRCEVVPVQLTKHENADLLSIIPVFGYTYVGSTKDWENVKLGVYFPPDTLVDTTQPEFIELANNAKYAADSTKGGSYARIRAKRIRGAVSYGFMIPAPPTAQLGDDLANYYGVAHYEPGMQKQHGGKGSFITGSNEVEAGPNVYTVKYDVDSFQRYAKEMFDEGEAVFVTEKIHGANGRWVFHNGRMYCGSRTEWKREYATIVIPDRNEVIAKLTERMKAIAEPEAALPMKEEVAVQADKIIENIRKKNEHPMQNAWWRGLSFHPEVREWCEDHPDVVVYGELYGAVQNLRYSVPNNEVRIAVFDLLNSGAWMDPHSARLAAPQLPWVPTVADSIPFSFDCLVEMAEGASLVPGALHYREGIVVSPVHERNHPRLGRVKLKVVSLTYLEKS